MSDIEIIEIETTGIGRKRNSEKRSRSERKNEFKKRKRSSSGLIQDSRNMKGTETHFKDFVLDRTETLKRSECEEENMDIEILTPSTWNEQLQKFLLGASSSAQQQRKKRRKNICYNCDGEHNLVDCQKPKDFRRISQKRREHADEIRRRQLTYARYTDENEKKNFQPGKISSGLRFALGLDEHDIPEYIYRMRRLGFVKGYPPGYLKKAIKNSDSNALLKIIEIDAEKMPKEEKREEAPVLEPGKMICYMGFNGTYKKLRDLEEFNVPPIDVFCDKYQEELKMLFKKEQKKKKKEAKKHIKFTQDQDDDDVVVIDEKPDDQTDNCVLPGEEADLVFLSKDETIYNDSVNEGESMFFSIGTPVERRKTSVLPSIDAFSVGIIPFEAKEECTDNKGIFKRLMSKLRSK